jgi:hypothetical protein
MNKRNKKISKVMREYKAGTLKSGGSGKKVTNPKQAMAIALSEAKNMNQGGMLNNIYQRPMFQTPQTKQGSGIMAGVAPVRGFENGGYAGYMPDTGGYEGYLEDITADDVSDFFTTDKGSLIGENEQGPTVTARDITDLFIVDPEDPIDVALATATAGLLAAGITAPAAMIAQLARMGYKGSKVIDKVSKAVEVGKSGTLKGLESTRQVSRIGTDILEDEAIAEELPQESRSSGIASLLNERSEEMPEQSDSVSDIDIDYDRVRALSGMKYADGGIVSLKKGALVSKFAQEIIDVAKDIYRGEGVAKKMLEDAVKKGDVLVDEVPKVLRSIKSAVKKSQNPKTQKPKNPKTKKAEKPKKEKPKEEMTPPPEPPERPEGRAFLDDLAVRGLSSVGRGMKKAGVIGSGLIGGAGLFGYDALTGSGEEQDVKAKEIAKAKEMKAAEEAKLAEAEELRRIADEEYNNRSLLTKTSDFIGSAVKKLQDPRVQAGLAKAAQPSAGFVPRNMFSDINEGMREYDLERATIASSEPEIIQTQKALIGLIEENTGESLSKDSQLLILQSLFADEAAASNAATLFEYAKQNPQVVDQDFYQKALNEVLTGSTIGSAIGQIMNPQAQ